MAEYIELEAGIAIIEEKQKELCPVGRYGRGYVYGSDREKYDAVVNFKASFSAEKQLCLSCAARVCNFVENCAKMDGGDSGEAD